MHDEVQEGWWDPAIFAEFARQVRKEREKFCRRARSVAAD
jgi:hypothetical protein